MEPQSKIESEVDKALSHPPCTFQGLPRSEFLHRLEASFPMERIRTHKIIKIIDGGEDVIIKWDKRPFVLTDKELSLKYTHPALKTS